MMVSTRGRYALRVMIELASRGGEEYVPLKEIAQKQEISEKYLEAIIKTLVKNGLVVGLRGKGGGYKLATAPDRCTVAAILRLTEGSLAPVSCLSEGENPCPRAEVCATLPMWTQLHHLIEEYLESVTLEDLVKQSVGDPGGCYVI